MKVDMGGQMITTVDMGGEMNIRTVDEVMNMGEETNIKAIEIEIDTVIKGIERVIDSR